MCSKAHNMGQTPDLYFDYGSAKEAVLEYKLTGAAPQPQVLSMYPPRVDLLRPRQAPCRAATK